MSADSPHDTVLKLRSAELWRSMADANKKLATMIARKRDEAARYYLSRITNLFLGMPPPPKSAMGRPSLLDFETAEIVAELRRRVREERDSAAPAALCERMPARRIVQRKRP